MSPTYVNMELNIWRYITHGREDSDHKGHKMYSRDDFRCLDLPADWFYVLNQHGEGMAVHFPMKAKPVLL